MPRFVFIYIFLACFGAHGAPVREVAITIDDLPRGGDAAGTPEINRAMTTKLLAPFRESHIPLIGFVNECLHAGELPGLLAMWVAAGAELGNHTCSHSDLNGLPAAVFEAEIAEGESITTAAQGHRPVYFRYPFLHTGKDAETRQDVERFLASQGYRNAPVTLDNSDYIFARVYANALATGDLAKAQHVHEAYLKYMESIFEFFETRSIEVTGHEVRQILLMRANQLNADSMPDLLAMMRHRGYTFISLEHALQDPAYSLPDTYVGLNGFSWIHRWSLAKGMKNKEEPEEPDWIRKDSGL
jgi:peptidoglycan/xylan/chitin deacetylase (PgdA/CDA1 family)